jgi:hypothetical protein
MPNTEVASPAPRKSRAAKRRPTEEQIQQRAYEIYLQRQGAPGNPLQDWIQAERELLANPPKAARSTNGRSKAKAL